MGRATEIKTVPYFWSAMFGKTIRYAGRYTPFIYIIYDVSSVFSWHLISCRWIRDWKVELLYCHLAVNVKKRKTWKWESSLNLIVFFFLWLRKTNISVSYFVFVKVTVMDLMMSSYKEIWMNWDSWRFTQGTFFFITILNKLDNTCIFSVFLHLL